MGAEKQPGMVLKVNGQLGAVYTPTAFLQLPHMVWPVLPTLLGTTSVFTFGGAALFGALFLTDSQSRLRTQLTVNGTRARREDERRLACVLVPAIGAVLGAVTGFAVGLAGWNVAYALF